MSEPKDPERLLADALRAQAVFAPHALPPTTPDGSGSFSASGGPGLPGSGTGSFSASAAAPATASETGPTTELPPNYGLLSGAGADSLARERAALEDASRTTGSIPQLNATDPTMRRPPADQEPSPAPSPAPGPAAGPLPAYWVLLLAVLLGLAAGSVIGLITLV